MSAHVHVRVIKSGRKSLVHADTACTIADAVDADRAVVTPDTLELVWLRFTSEFMPTSGYVVHIYRTEDGRISVMWQPNVPKFFQEKKQDAVVTAFLMLA